MRIRVDLGRQSRIQNPPVSWKLNRNGVRDSMKPQETNKGPSQGEPGEGGDVTAGLGFHHLNEFNVADYIGPCPPLPT